MSYRRRPDGAAPDVQRRILQRLAGAGEGAGQIGARTGCRGIVARRLSGSCHEEPVPDRAQHQWRICRYRQFSRLARAVHRSCHRHIITLAVGLAAGQTDSLSKVLALPVYCAVVVLITLLVHPLARRGWCFVGLVALSGIALAVCHRHFE
jgi:hypothetical protein